MTRTRIPISLSRIEGRAAPVDKCQSGPPLPHLFCGRIVPTQQGHLRVALAFLTLVFSRSARRAIPAVSAAELAPPSRRRPQRQACCVAVRSLSGASSVAARTAGRRWAKPRHSRLRSRRGGIPKLCRRDAEGHVPRRASGSRPEGRRGHYGAICVNLVDVRSTYNDAQADAFDDVARFYNARTRNSTIGLVRRAMSRSR